MVLFQEAPYEYLDTSGKAIGIVEIMKTLPEEVVHGRPLAQDEKKVVVSIPKAAADMTMMNLLRERFIGSRKCN